MQIILIFLNQQENYKNLKARFNEILVQPISNDFELIDTIPNATTLNVDELYGKLLIQNPQLISAKSRQRIAELNIKEVSADRYPTLRLNSGYKLQQSKCRSRIFY